MSFHVDEVIEAIKFDNYLEELAKMKESQKQHKPKQISKKEGRKA